MGAGVCAPVREPVRATGACRPGRECVRSAVGVVLTAVRVAEGLAACCPAYEEVTRPELFRSLEADTRFGESESLGSA